MKKKILSILVIILVLCMGMFTLTSCGGGEPTHAHTFDKQVATSEYLSKDATCENNAEYYYSCSCGEKGTITFKYGEKLGHAYSDWISIGNGQHKKTCANDNSHTIIENCSGGNATCTKKATCKDCGTEYGSKKSHSYTILKQSATQHWYECICGAYETKENHIPGAAATETTDQKCTECNYVITPALGHVHTLHLTKVDAKPQSCTQEGNREYYTCSCDKWFTNNSAITEITDKTSVVIAKDDHSYTELKKSATQHWYECTCGAFETKDNHEGGTATCQVKASCSICDTFYGDFAEHSPKQEWIITDTHHYHECVYGCTQKLTYREHDFVNGTCEICKKYAPVSETDFNEALKAFGNYTVNVQIDDETSEDYSATLMVMGDYGKLNNSNNYEEYYTKKAEESIEEQAEFSIAFVHVFQEIQFEYFSYEDGWLNCKSSSISSISDLIPFYDVISAKIKIVDQKIISAVVVALSTFGNEEISTITYVFSNYGITSFVKPSGLASETDFNEALKAFGNYTVNVQIDDETSEDYSATLMVMGDYGKLNNSNNYEEYYTKKAEESIEEQAEFSIAFVHVFQEIQFEYFSYEDGWLNCKSSSISSISDLIPFYDVISAKIKIVDQKIISAVVVALSTFGNEEISTITYVFSNYGITSFVKPSGLASETDFNEALKAFGNYTVNVQIDDETSEDYSATLMVMGDYGKLNNSNNYEEYYTKKAEESIEEQAEFSIAFVHVFQEIQFEYFSYEDGWLNCKSSSISSISDLIPFYDVISAKIKIVDQKIISAVVVALSTFGNEEISTITYVFSNYGNTIFNIA